MSLWVRTVLFTGPAHELPAAIEAHRQHLRELAAGGKVRIAGELGHGDGILDVFEAKDRREAEEIARSSPLVIDGLGACLLREWTELDLG